MKLQIIIDDQCQEQVLVYARQRTELVDAIERLVNEYDTPLVGYTDKQIVPFDLDDVCCFTVESNKVYAMTEKEKLGLKCRLYTLETQLPDRFIKINQSCIANIRMIERFDASISGTLQVRFKNGYVDYVSRRNIKNVKERLGL